MLFMIRSLFVFLVLNLLEVWTIAIYERDQKNIISEQDRRGSEFTDDSKLKVNDETQNKAETKKRGIYLGKGSSYQGGSGGHYGGLGNYGGSGHGSSGYHGGPDLHTSSHGSGLYGSSGQGYGFPSGIGGGHYGSSGHSGPGQSGHGGPTYLPPPDHTSGHGVYQESHGQGHGHGGVNPYAHKALALKGILIPLAGLALLGAAAAFSTNPVLLQLGVLNGRRRRRSTTANNWLDTKKSSTAYPQNPFVRPNYLYK